MANLFYDASRFIIAGLFALYTAGSLFALRRFGNKTGNAACAAQYTVLFVMQLSCYCVLCLQKMDYYYLVFFAIQQLVFLVVINLYRMLYPTCSRLLMNHMFLLLGTGLVVIMRLSKAKAVRQFVIISISLLIGLVIPELIKKWKFLRRFTWGYALIGLAAISSVLLLGTATNGSKISYTLAGITFQPSEFVKILFIFFLAGALSEATSLRRLILVSAVSFAHVAILVCSKDLGSAAIFFVAYLFMIFIATGRKRCLLIGGIFGLGGGVLSYKLFYHVKVRVLAWLNPWRDITGKGYQMAQSLFAIGTGGWFGLGLCQGKPETIPYVEADFIFSAISEELGVLYALCLILICVSCFIIGIGIALHTKDKFYKLIASGISVTYLFQILLTIGGGTKFIPLTGVTLPLVSYGGSSVMVTIFMFSILQGIRIASMEEHDREESVCEPAEAENETDVENSISEEPVQDDPETDKQHRSGVAIYLTMIVFCIIFAALTIYLFYFMTVQKQAVVENPYNVTRQEILAAKVRRGQIKTEQGTVLAYTKVDEDGNEIRVYPYNNLFAHAVGYATHGRMGIESMENFTLITSHESLTNHIQNELNDDKDRGDNVITTLNLDVQQAAYHALMAYKGSIIVTEVSTGKILAMVSLPDFDPNEIDAIWEKLMEDEESSVLVNRATQGMYPPGSTFKILTALEYIREHPDDYMDYRFECNGRYQADDGTTVHCYNHHAHGTVDFEESFAYSCNSSFANIGMSLDRTTFAKTLDELLFGHSLPGELSGSKSSITMDDTISEYDMMQTAIGQGKTLMTPMHLNMITCAIANRGILMKPYMVSGIENYAGTLLTSYDPVEYGRLMSEEEAQILKELMTAVCDYGTARRFDGEDYTAAGKTGSAEYESASADGGTTMQSHAWFTGFAPVEDPQIAVTVIIEGAGSGGDYAVPMAKQVFRAYFEQLDSEDTDGLGSVNTAGNE